MRPRYDSPSRNPIDVFEDAQLTVRRNSALVLPIPATNIRHSPSNAQFRSSDSTLFFGLSPLVVTLLHYTWSSMGHVANPVGRSFFSEGTDSVFNRGHQWVPHRLVTQMAISRHLSGSISLKLALVGA